LNSFLNFVKTEQRPNSLLENLLEEMITKLPDEVITLVVDEANLPFTINGDSSVADIQQVKATLALFTKLTKEELNKVCALIIFNIIKYNNRNFHYVRH
jgi:hypothetical protein